MIEDTDPFEVTVTTLFLILAAVAAVSVTEVAPANACVPACSRLGLAVIRASQSSCVCGGSGPIREITP